MIDISTLPGAIPANTGSISDVSAFGSFGRGLTSMLPGGNAIYSGVASQLQNEPVKQENQELAQEQQEDSDENPISTLAGKATGIVAPALVTGGASAPESLGGAALQGAGIGSLYGAGNAATTLENGGSGTQALEDVAAGAGTGALTGGAISALGSGAGAARDALQKTTPGKRIMSNEIAQWIGINPRAALVASKTEVASPEQAMVNIKNDINSILSPDLKAEFSAPTSNLNDKYTILQNLKNASGSTLGVQRDLMGAQATAANFPEGQETIDALKQAAESYKGIPTDGAVTSINSLADKLQSIQDAGKLDFNTLDGYRQTIGQGYNMNGNPPPPGADIIYRTLSNNLDKSITRIGAIDQPGYIQAMRTYKVTSRLLPLIQKGAAREATATQGLGNLVGGALTLGGHPAGLVLPVAKYVQGKVAPQLLENTLFGPSSGAGNTVRNLAAQAAAANVPPQQKVQGMADGGVVEPQMKSQVVNQYLQNTPRVPVQPVINSQTQQVDQVSPSKLNEPILSHPDLQPFKQVFDQVNQGVTDPEEIKKRNIATDFLLQQRDPRYAAALAKSKNVVVNY